MGNQFFIIATATSLALDHGAIAVFPDLENKKAYNIPLNREKVFSHLSAYSPRKVRSTYQEPFYHYQKIPYRPNMKIRGYFQSEKYFAHHRKEIMELFAPSSAITEYLWNHYSDLLLHSQTVSIHIRFYHEDPLQKCHLAPRRDYIEKAISLFPEESLFVVFSNQTENAKQLLSGIDRNFRFIEGEAHYHDFYLMSLCKDNIICNSSFSWWAAYLNPNFSKTVVAPRAWYNPAYGLNTQDLLPETWIAID